MKRPARLPPAVIRLAAAHRAADRPRGWALGAAAGVHRVRVPLAWAAAGLFVAVCLVVPDLHSGLLTGALLMLLTVTAFFVARTRTLSWQALAWLTALGLPWAVLTGLAARTLAAGVADGRDLDPAAAATVLAPLVEQSSVLIPLLGLALVRPTRVREFSATDWLVAALALGVSFQLAEDLLRAAGGDAGSGFVGSDPWNGVTGWTGAGFAGRPVLAALAGVGAGLAVATWRSGRRPRAGRRATSAVRGLAVLIAAACWWLAVSAQAGWNQQTSSVAALPAPLDWTATVTGGRGPVWLLPGLFLAALLVDGARLRNAAEIADDPLPVPAPPSAVGDRWAASLTRWAGTRDTGPVEAVVWLVAAGCSSAAHTVRDLSVVLVAHSRALRPGEGRRRADARRRPGRESRAVAIARGRSAGVMVRSVRAEAIALSAGAHTPRTRRATRAAAAAALAGLLVAACWLGPFWLARQPSVVTVGPDRSTWMAGALAALTSPGPPLWQWLLAAVGFMALVVLVAAPLDLPVAGRHSIWFATRSTEGPGVRTRVATYLAAAGPAEVCVDAVSAVIGSACDHLPGPFAESSVRREVRAAVLDFISDPQGFISSRRASVRATSGPPTQPILLGNRPHTSPDLPPVKLADGRLLSALSAADERLFMAGLDDLVRDRPGTTVRGGRDADPAERYRARIYGDDERLVSLRLEKWSDGHNTAYGMLGDIAYYDGRGSSWYLPDTLPESVRHRANLEMDRRLIEFAAVVYYPASPFRALEVTTNHPLVAKAFELRMARLAIPGYVVLES